MDYSQISVLLTLAFGLGLLHSLDADHIMAVSNLASGRRGVKSNIHFCLRWASGHGLTLFIVGLFVFVLGLSLPQNLSLYAERAVALILIIIGLYVLFDVWRRRIHIHFHHHDDLPAHAHWHSHAKQDSHAKQESHKHSHTALFVGMLHGLAGSAPLLALIPVTMGQQPMIGFIYLIIFSLGVIIAMLLFGGLLGYFSNIIITYSEKIFRLIRTLLGVGAIGVGSVILLGTRT